MIRAVMYGIQVFYSYLLMLVAMTYQVNTVPFDVNLRLTG
jgi:Ctr copper transporter family